MDFSDATDHLNKVVTNIGDVIRGQEDTIKLLVAAFIAGGHVLMEDVPGTGKTTLAKSFAKSVELGFQRIQFTPDLLPSDILGVNIYDQSRGEFIMHKGAIFTDILLADEINRASPRTQSALLEAMAEKQVSIEREINRLSDNFFVIATQNPVESHGTYPLPEAQMDRFFIKIKLGYIEAEEEVTVLSQMIEQHPVELLQSVVSASEITKIIDVVKKVRISEEIKRYIVDIVSKTRSYSGVLLGASPRASIAMLKMAQACSLINGEDFVTPDIIQELVKPVMAHRITLDQQQVFSGNSAEKVLDKIIAEIAVPA